MQILVDFVSIRTREIANWKCCFQTLSHVFENRSVIAPDNAKLCPKYPPMHVSRTAGQEIFCTTKIQSQTSSSLSPQSSRTAPATASTPMRRTKTSRCPTHTRPCRIVLVQTAAPHPQQSTEIPCLPQSPTRRIWRRNLYSNSARSS